MMEVKRIKEFNLALLDRWCWRVLVERESLWCRVLAANYGEEGGNHVIVRMHVQFGGKTLI